MSWLSEAADKASDWARDLTGVGGSGPAKRRGTGYSKEASRALQDLAGIAQEQWDAYEREFLPVAGELREEAQLTPARMQRAAQTAGASAEQQFSRADDIRSRNLSRMGVNPGSGRFAGQERSAALGRAAGVTQATNAARRAQRQRSDQIRGGLLGTGTNISGQASQATGNVAQGYGSLASQQYGREQGALDRGSRFLETLWPYARGGPVRRGYAEGGAVDAEQTQPGWLEMPTDARGGDPAQEGGELHGPGTGTSDTIEARVSDGEYIIPEYAVRFYGTKKLDDMLKKAAENNPEALPPPGQGQDQQQGQPPVDEQGRPMAAAGWLAAMAPALSGAAQQQDEEPEPEQSSYERYMGQHDPWNQRPPMDAQGRPRYLFGGSSGSARVVGGGGGSASMRSRGGGSFTGSARSGMQARQPRQAQPQPQQQQQDDIPDVSIRSGGWRRPSWSRQRWAGGGAVDTRPRYQEGGSPEPRTQTDVSAWLGPDWAERVAGAVGDTGRWVGDRAGDVYDAGADVIGYIDDAMPRSRIERQVNPSGRSNNPYFAGGGAVDRRPRYAAGRSVRASDGAEAGLDYDPVAIIMDEPAYRSQANDAGRPGFAHGGGVDTGGLFSLYGSDSPYALIPSSGRSDAASSTGRRAPPSPPRRPMQPRYLGPQDPRLVARNWQRGPALPRGNDATGLGGGAADAGAGIRRGGARYVGGGVYQAGDGGYTWYGNDATYTYDPQRQAWAAA